MDFKFTEEQLKIQQMAADFAKNELAPTILERDEKGEFPTELQLNKAGDTLYWLNGGVWRMSIEASTLPTAALLSSGFTSSYGLTLDPSSEDIYVSDAIDYQQNGMVFRYSVEGEAIDSFGVGICPSAFCWK